MDVTFDEGPLTPSRVSAPTTGIVGFLLRHHIVTTVRSAHIALLCFSICIFIASFSIAKNSMQREDINTYKNFVPAMVQ